MRELHVSAAKAVPARLEPGTPNPLRLLSTSKRSRRWQQILFRKNLLLVCQTMATSPCPDRQPGATRAPQAIASLSLRTYEPEWRMRRRQWTPSRPHHFPFCVTVAQNLRCDAGRLRSLSVRQPRRQSGLSALSATCQISKCLAQRRRASRDGQHPSSVVVPPCRLAHTLARCLAISVAHRSCRATRCGMPFWRNCALTLKITQSQDSKTASGVMRTAGRGEKHFLLQGINFRQHCTAFHG